MRPRALLLIAAFTAGCASRPLYQPVSFTEPNPFTKPSCKLAIEDIHSDHLMVEGKTEAEWLAGKGPQQQASYQEDKRTGQAKLTAYLQKRLAALLVPAGASGDNVFVLRPVFTDWDPGAYGNRPGMARMTFDVLDAAGKVLDQFTFQGNVFGFSSGERMWGAYITAGWAVEQYLGNRWHCAAR
jgi:hypothetical protein